MDSSAVQLYTAHAKHYPAWRPITSLVLDGIASPHTHRAYAQALEEFLIWFMDVPGREFNKAAVLKYRAELELKGLAPSSINVRLSAIRRLALEAADNGLLAPVLAAGVSRAKGPKRAGVRLGHWLSAEQAERLMRAPDATTLKGLRDRAIMAILLGAGLRRSELAALDVQHMQQREGRWVIVNLTGKQRRIRSVPIAAWVHDCIVSWQTRAEINTGPLFRPLNRRGEIMASRLSPQTVFHCIKSYADTVHIPIAPHDLRRTFAKLAYAGHARLEQIQLSLGHSSLTTTEIYLGAKQSLVDAPCDHLGLNLQIIRELEPDAIS